MTAAERAPRGQDARVRALVGLLRAAGVGPVFVCPGSRSTPLVQALAEAGYVPMHPIWDERSAAFAALGATRSGARPVVVTTSGSAVAHLLPALVEAGECGLGFVALTADRPAAVRGLGAPQTVVQPGLLAPYARTITLPADGGGAAFEQGLQRVRAELAAAWRGAPMPNGGARALHLNVELDKPLAMAPAAAAATAAGAAAAAAAAAAPAAAAAAPAAPHPPHDAGGLHPAVLSAAAIPPPAPGERVAVIAGPSAGGGALASLAERLPLGVLLFAEIGSGVPLAGLRGYERSLASRAARDGLGLHRIVRCGHWPVCRQLQSLLEEAPALGVVIDVIAPGRPSDPTRSARLHTAAPIADALAGWKPTSDAGDPAWAASIRRRLTAEFAAPAPAQAAVLGPDAILGALFALSAGTAPSGPRSRLLLGNSMAIRDADRLWPPASPAAFWPEVHVNRGANGIDGTIATAFGLALAAPERPVWVYLGDGTTLHDIGSLQLLAEPDCARAPIRLVVADNGGGAIFDRLPAAQVLPAAVHERFFRVPHGLDVAAIAAGFGVPSRTVTQRDALAGAFAWAELQPRSVLLRCRF